ncbi:hypothetical protein BDV96DRAFT_643176 [Lophiotrema nucula]|uniref:Uncharacterized protein n=1 Tax=Lophiotrema nucula TaxID=690887 RepID=A0A6A5ZJH7_9PLEO|nr:hypothetical protein BDV96DRAFT_643176 [Lophiotrema nucula]
MGLYTAFTIVADALSRAYYPFAIIYLDPIPAGAAYALAIILLCACAVAFYPDKWKPKTQPRIERHSQGLPVKAKEIGARPKAPTTSEDEVDSPTTVVPTTFKTPQTNSWPEALEPAPFTPTPSHLYNTPFPTLTPTPMSGASITSSGSLHSTSSTSPFAKRNFSEMKNKTPGTYETWMQMGYLNEDGSPTHKMLEHPQFKHLFRAGLYDRMAPIKFAGEGGGKKVTSKVNNGARVGSAGSFRMKVAEGGGENGD